MYMYLDRYDTHTHTHTRKYHKETPCVATFISNKQKCNFSLFSSTKLENRRAEKVLGGEGRSVWYQWEGEVAGKGCGKVNAVQKMCTHVYKCKTETCWNCLGMGEWKWAMEGVISTMIYLIHYKSFCKCHNIPLPSTTIFLKDMYFEVTELLDPQLSFSLTPSFKFTNNKDFAFPFVK
jgi:hypothetical protein